jgi:succinyl-diaminopimelate desuccinylase
MAALPKDDERRDRWVEHAVRHIDDAENLSLLASIVNIASPTGEERPLAEYLCQRMQTEGLRSEVQPIDATSANALGRLGDGIGPSLLLFAPLDSAFSGIAAEELPWSGPEMRPDLLPKAIVEGDRVIGLSADNPKAHIVALIAAARAVSKARIPLTGRVQLAFGAGGAPSNRRPGLTRFNVGHGTGCEFMLQQGVRGDFAIIAKPGYAVAWEEVGLVWFHLRIHGTQAYVGRRHVLVDDNPIVHAATVIQTLEPWFGEYAQRHTSGLCQPQGAIGAIEGGWTYKPAFTPAACDLYVDLRITPRCPPLQAWRELQTCLDQVRAKGIRIDCELIVAVPGQATDPANWIIRSCIAAWEATEGRKHQPFVKTSGQTEAVILRRHGIPTARFGLPAIMSPELLSDGSERPKHTMGIVNGASIRKYCECIVRVIVDTCTRNLDEVGL